MTLGPRIIAGAWRGRKLQAPLGLSTRPTSGRARQAAFDILMHASWAGPDFIQKARVLDLFAGTGAYGLEALSRGALSASFAEQDGLALAALRANIAACRAETRCAVLARDALSLGPGIAHDLVFIDPPYGRDLVRRAVHAADLQGWVAPGAVMMAELGPEDVFEPENILTTRQHGKARLIYWRHS